MKGLDWGHSKKRNDRGQKLPVLPNKNHRMEPTKHTNYTKKYYTLQSPINWPTEHTEEFNSSEWTDPSLVNISGH